VSIYVSVGCRLHQIDVRGSAHRRRQTRFWHGRDRLPDNANTFTFTETTTSSDADLPDAEVTG